VPPDWKETSYNESAVAGSAVESRLLSLFFKRNFLFPTIIRAIRKIPRRSPSFVGDKARVVSRLGPEDEAQYMVEVHIPEAQSPPGTK
jgi:hypothetical protein